MSISFVGKNSLIGSFGAVLTILFGYLFNSWINIPVLPIKIGNLGFLILSIFVWLFFRLARLVKESTFYAFMNGSFMAICMFFVNDTAKYLESILSEYGFSALGFVVIFMVCAVLLSMSLNFVGKKIWKRTLIHD